MRRTLLFIYLHMKKYKRTKIVIKETNMRKTLLKLLSCLTFGVAFAQNDLPRVDIFEPQGGILDSLWGSWVQGVSHNGEYAVGYGNEYTTWSFIWDRTSGEYRLITGAYKNISCANGVSNDGLVVGSFLSSLKIWHAIPFWLIVSVEKSIESLMGIPLCVICRFSLAAFNILSLSLIFVN